MHKVICVTGTRPQFIKHAALMYGLREADYGIEALTIDTGQHYSPGMRRIFYDQLRIPEPTHHLEVGSANHGQQTGIMLIEIEKILMRDRPDGVIVYGDTNTTLAAALAAVKLHIPLVHVEAGLRSFNRRMPEEINRVATDHMSTLLCAPTATAVQNLKREGIMSGVFMTGDIMRDALHLAQKEIRSLADKAVDSAYYHVTLHRPYNTDDRERLLRILDTLNHLPQRVHFAMHPRTRNQLEAWDVPLDAFANVRITEPLSYFENLRSMANADAIITDSGGMQKEAYWLKKRCITIRPETEWVETLENDWNTLVFENVDEIESALKSKTGLYNSSLYGDGYARQRIWQSITDYFEV